MAIIFLPCGFYLSFFFFSSPNLSGRRLDVYRTSTHGGLGVNLECRSETCCAWLTENTARKKIAKKSPSGHTPSHNFVGLYLRNYCPLPSNRHHRSCGDRLEGKEENYQVCSVQYCVQQLCTVRCTHI